MSLTPYRISFNALESLIRYFKSEFNLSPIIGAEIEFYIHGKINIQHLSKMISLEIEEEMGNEQYEVKISESEDIISWIKNVNHLRNEIIFHASRMGTIADFSPKPFAEDYGSAIHIHLNFLEDNDIEKYAIILCHSLSDVIDIFIPTEKHLERLQYKFMAPTHISYGNNNRSVMIRIPDSVPRRLEHRLPSADADILAIIYTILNSIKKGLEGEYKIKPIPKIFGNAFDDQYYLKTIHSLKRNR